MRFALIILLYCLIARPSYAAPGDTYNAETKWSTQASTKRQVRTNDAPIAPEGFNAKKVVSKLGRVVAVAVIDNDIFIADADKDRVLRLKSRRAITAFETRAEFLIGFDTIQDLATAEGVLYMSDNAGVWKIRAGEMLMATVMPKLIYKNPLPSGNPIHIAMSLESNTLVIGQGNKITALALATNQLSALSTGLWQIQDIAVSPGGGIWASVLEDGASYIVPIRSHSENVERLKLPPGAIADHIKFWTKDVFPKDWPEDWASDLIFSIKGNRPMIARAHFNYGDIAAEFTGLIDGFSLPSRFIGRREYWGAPTTIDMLSNGQLIFVEHEQGTLWVLEKGKSSPEKPETKHKTTEPVSEKPDEAKKLTPPVLQRGSSIGSASSLETDELLRRSTLLPGQKASKNED